MLKMFLNSPIRFKILVLGIAPAFLFITTVIPDNVLGPGIYDCQARICVLNPWTDWVKTVTFPIIPNPLSSIAIFSGLLTSC